MDIDDLKAHLEWAEGRRNFPYEDSVGKLTIGIGRNLDDVGLSDDEVDMCLQNDIERVLGAVQNLSFWDGLDPVRQLVVADMVFNLGFTRFLGFIKTISALEAGDYQTAADEMKDSRWYRQTGRRAQKLVQVMRTGEWIENA